MFSLWFSSLSCPARLPFIMKSFSENILSRPQSAGGNHALLRAAMIAPVVVKKGRPRGDWAIAPARSLSDLAAQRHFWFKLQFLRTQTPLPENLITEALISEVR